MRALLDLVLPAVCSGCDAPGEVFCRSCQKSLWPQPRRVVPRVDPGVPCWAVGDYGGRLRRAILAGKDHGRREVAPAFGRIYAGALNWMRNFGELDHAELAPLVIVPAPSAARAARRRGGDPVVLVDDVLTTGATVSESVAALTAAGATVTAVLVLARA
jgi:predicted amidophosphoribosyltransferase